MSNGHVTRILICRSEAETTNIFLHSYNEEDLEGHLQENVGGFSASYRAMCYTLIHEQEILSNVFEQNPLLWNITSLAELQSRVWSFLDQA